MTFPSLISGRVIRAPAAAVRGVPACRSSLESLSFQLVHLPVRAARSAKWSGARPWEPSPTPVYFLQQKTFFGVSSALEVLLWIIVINPDHVREFFCVCVHVSDNIPEIIILQAKKNEVRTCVTIQARFSSWKMIPGIVRCKSLDKKTKRPRFHVNE